MLKFFLKSSDDRKLLNRYKCIAFFFSPSSFLFIDPVGPTLRHKGKHYLRIRWLCQTGTVFNALLNSTKS